METHGTHKAGSRADYQPKSDMPVQITMDLATHADLVFEIAVKNETAVRCLDEAVWWTHRDSASVRLFPFYIYIDSFKLECFPWSVLCRSQRKLCAFIKSVISSA